MIKRILVGVLRLCTFIFWAFLMTACNSSYKEPIISLDQYRLDEEFSLSVVASEPHLKAPVAIDFDSKGRIWAVQMPGYMNDMQGTQETEPVGSIVILEDSDGDGVVDHSKPFLDSLVMPRALAHVYGGLLYAEPPNLWFVEIENDKPVNRVLVDSIYAVDGNPEHQPNGLLLNIDNWIYSAKSNFRYRRVDNAWEKQPTTFRGQWGISHDNFGRLYYNDNSRQLLGDHVLPNRFIRNKYFTPKVAVNRMLTKDQRVYPLHATTVNRGYASGVLNQDSILLNTTAACSPLVYRGGLFPSDYDENVFVCIPEGNLIKRNVLTFHGDSTTAKQAWEGKEFLASSDEGFKPVNLNNGPDGSLYIVDMHRGMIGHHAYLSPYLKKKVKGNKLDTLTNFGRILKVGRSLKKSEAVPDFDTLDWKELIVLLNHDNGWIRDRTQHQLIFRNEKNSIEDLKTITLTEEKGITRIHALYVLEGLNELSFDFLIKVIVQGSPEVASHAVILLDQFASEANIDDAEALFKDLIARNEISIDLYLSGSLGVWLDLNAEKFLPQIRTLLERHSDRPIFREAVISGLEGNEPEVMRFLTDSNQLDDNEFIAHLTSSIERKEAGEVNPIFSRKSLSKDNRTHGAKLFYEICASCHGINGQGIAGLAPPLKNSEHVADGERLGLIVLHGLDGPVNVNSKRYDFNLAMPGLIRNDNISDKDIVAIIAYVTNAFSDRPLGLKTEKVAELRKTLPQSGMEYTEDELLEYSEK